MARIRSIHPDACKSEKLAQVSGDAERCYWRLQTHCDDAGRCEDHPRLIWASLFPLHEEIGPVDVIVWLDELEGVGLVVRYTSNDRRYLAVTQWDRFQHPQRPKPSTFPEPSATSNGHVRDASATDIARRGEGVGDGGEKEHVALKRDGPVEIVFQAWQESTRHHKAVLDPKRRALIVKALKHYPLEDLCDACRGVLMFPHNRGETNGICYDALELVLRDSEHIERFRDQARAGPAPPKGAGGLVRAVQNGALDV